VRSKAWKLSVVRTPNNYLWGEICAGWRLLKTHGLSVIQKRIPPGGAEVKHCRQHAHQFFFVPSAPLSGTLF
jgi:hypothetical protein